MAGKSAIFTVIGVLIFSISHLEDAQGLAEVQALSSKAAYQGQIPSSYLDNITVAQKAEEWVKVLQNSTSQTILAHKADAGVVVFINFGEFRDQGLSREQVAEIRAPYIHPRHWRQGIGTELYNLAANQCRISGIKLLALWVLDSNEPAKHFYRSMGFQIDGRARIDRKIPACELKEVLFSKHIC